MYFFPHNQLLLCGKFDIMINIYGYVFITIF